MMENVQPTTTTAPRLYRSATDKVIAGVCGGLAAYFKIDPVIVRLAFVFFALAGGASVLLYIVLWIAVPIGDTTQVSAIAGLGRGAETAGFILIGLGVLVLLGNLGLFRLINWSLMWPIALVVLGAALLLRRS